LQPDRDIHESTKDTKARKTAFHTKTRKHERLHTVCAGSEEADFRVPSQSLLQRRKGIWECVVDFRSDTTVRWACRAGDYLLWARSLGIFAPSDQPHALADIWEFRDGDFVTLTNRVADLPTGFELHPLEVAGSLAYWMMKRLNEGYRPAEPIDGPNLWRVRAGDRVAWVGASRSGVRSDDGVLEVVNFQVDALVNGEPLMFIEGAPTFGGVTDPESVIGKRLCSAGMAAILEGGSPRTIAADPQWHLG
jgi:hypothetical protein